MGMFDQITCDYPLPDSAVQRELFQTKNLNCLMDQYTITADGRLILHKVRYEAVPEEERPYYGDPKWEENSFFQLIGSSKSIPVEDEEIPYHGYIRFYTSLGKGEGREAFEYLAKFTDGRLQSLERVPKDYPDPPWANS